MERPKPFKYKVKNPHKYSGDLNDVVSRSSWETRFMLFCDHNENILAWGSEHQGTVIPYISPVDNAYHRYYPDFIVRARVKNGSVKTILVEVKPFKETKPPRQPKKETRKAMKYYNNAKKTYLVNIAKWKAARIWCEQNGAEFMIFTEYELGIKTRKK